MQFLKPDGTLVSGSGAKAKRESAPLCITSQQKIDEYEATIAKLEKKIERRVESAGRAKIPVRSTPVVRSSTKIAVVKIAKEAAPKSESDYWWHPTHGPLRMQFPFPGATPLTKEEYYHRRRNLRQRGRELERWARSLED